MKLTGADNVSFVENSIRKEKHPGNQQGDIRDVEFQIS
jgi:hypothetical protein